MELRIGRYIRLGKCLALGLLIIALKVCAVEKLPVLKVGDNVFSNVTVVAVTPTDIYFTCPGGMANAKLKELNPELQKHFHYNATNAMAVEKKQIEATAQYHADLVGPPAQSPPKAGPAGPSGRRLGQGMTAATPANLTPDWPQWRGPDRTGVANSSPPLASAWSESGPKKVWESRPLHYAGGDGSPVVAQGRVYMFIHDKAKNQELVVCLSAQTGDTIWIQQFTSRPTMHNASATPCVVAGRLYITGARVSYCLDATTGASLWKQDTGVPAKDPTVNRTNQEVSSSFIVVNDIAATMLGPCYGLNTQTGQTVWTAPESGGYSGAMTSPVRWLHDGKAYLVYCGMWRMCCVAADNGTVFWDVKGNKTGKGCAPTPSLVGDDLAVYWRGKLGAYHLTDAGPKLLWAVKYFDPYSSPILDNGRVYAAGRQQDDTDTSLTCYDLATGQPRWVCSIPDPQYSSPILADGKLIVLGDKGKRLILVEALTGKLLANVPINGKLWSSPAFANGLLYVRLANDGLACYDLTAQTNP